jgi:hypothetical protein
LRRLRDDGWTIDRAETIRSVRGLPVRPLECRGVGRGRGEGEERRYDRIACRGAARRPGERYDSVVAHYVVVPGEGDDYRLEDVSFVGGPGIP